MKGDEGRIEDEQKISVKAFWFQANIDKLPRLFHSLRLRSYGQYQSAVCGVRRPLQLLAGSDWALHCDQCLPDNYGFSTSGCACEYENTTGEGRGDDDGGGASPPRAVRVSTRTKGGGEGPEGGTLTTVVGKVMTMLLISVMVEMMMTTTIQ